MSEGHLSGRTFVQDASCQIVAYRVSLERSWRLDCDFIIDSAIYFHEHQKKVLKVKLCSQIKYFMQVTPFFPTFPLRYPIYLNCEGGQMSEHLSGRTFVPDAFFQIVAYGISLERFWRLDCYFIIHSTIYFHENQRQYLLKVKQ